VTSTNEEVKSFFYNFVGGKVKSFLEYFIVFTFTLHVRMLFGPLPLSPCFGKSILD
jgi:hypothetical protein